MPLNFRYLFWMFLWSWSTSFCFLANECSTFAWVKNLMLLVFSSSMYFWSIYSVAMISLKLGISPISSWIWDKWNSTLSSSPTGCGYFLSICFLCSNKCFFWSWMFRQTSSWFLVWIFYRSSSRSYCISPPSRSSEKLSNSSSKSLRIPPSDFLSEHVFSKN